MENAPVEEANVACYTDDEMQTLIRDTFDEDAILDAGIDVLLYQLKQNSIARRPRWYLKEESIHDILGVERPAQFDTLMEDMIRNINGKLLERRLPLREATDDQLKERIRVRGEKIWDRFPPATTFRPVQNRTAHRDPLLDEARKTLAADVAPRLLAHELWPAPQISGTGSLANLAEADLLEQLMDAVDGYRSLATFTCGGSLDVDTTGIGSAVSRAAEGKCLPVSVDWQASHSGCQGRVVFPEHGVTTEAKDQNHDAFERLLQNCQAATFGRGKEEVLDLSYRKALSLHVSQFNTNFCPYRTGIVYSGPSGRFQPHVDTPRGEAHFASLVVSLPSPHRGGALIVKHKGKSITYDWSNLDAAKIAWAAFYSDCEHEVQVVEEGHRVTLTYHLHVRDQSSPLAGQVDFSQMVMPGIVRSFLEQPGFLRQGGVLGVFCNHRYAYGKEESSDRFPRILKGVDLAVYMAFASVGLRVGVYPILAIHDDFGGVFPRELRRCAGLEVSKTALERLKHYQKFGYHTKPFYRVKEPVQSSRLQLQYEGEDISGDEDELLPFSSGVRHRCECDTEPIRVPSFDDRLVELSQRAVKGLNQRHLQDRDVTVGLKVGPITFDDNDWGDGYTLDKVLDSTWPHATLDRVIWLNGVKYDEVQLANLAYGNQASLEWHYSTTAILVSVPPSAKRDLKEVGS